MMKNIVIFCFLVFYHINIFANNSNENIINDNEVNYTFKIKKIDSIFSNLILKILTEKEFDTLNYNLVIKEAESLFNSSNKLDELYKIKTILFDNNLKDDSVSIEISNLAMDFYFSLFQFARSERILNEKVILFISSLSCECTLEKQREYFKEILDYRIKNNKQFIFFVVNCYKNKDFMKIFDVYFLPTIISFSSNNNEINRIVLDGSIEKIFMNH